MDIPQWPVMGERELELLGQVLASDRWGGFHEFVSRFEREFAAFQHCSYGVSAMNGTVTLEMVLEALGIGSDAEVIVPAISFISTATAVSRVGAIPVFVDIESDTFAIDPKRVAAAVTKKTRAIMAVHFGGPMANMDSLCALAQQHSLALIEDAAHSQGAEWRGKRAGSFGIAGSFSFQNSKVMTAGEGGILTSNDEELSEQVRSIANQGRSRAGNWFQHDSLGTNYRMTAFQAAILLAQLERLPEQNVRRERNAAILRKSLGGVPGLRLQRIRPDAQVHTNYLFLGRIEEAQLGKSRDDFHQIVTRAGIPCTAFYPHTLYRNPVYQKLPCRVEPCPVSEECIQDAFWLPHRVLLGSEEETKELANILRQACE